MNWKKGIKRAVFVISIITFILVFFITDHESSYPHWQSDREQVLRERVLWAAVSFVMVWVIYYFIVWVVFFIVRWIIKRFRDENKKEKE